MKVCWKINLIIVRWLSNRQRVGNSSVTKKSSFKRLQRNAKIFCQRKFHRVSPTEAGTSVFAAKWIVRVPGVFQMPNVTNLTISNPNVTFYLTTTRTGSLSDSEMKRKVKGIADARRRTWVNNDKYTKLVRWDPCWTWWSMNKRLCKLKFTDCFFLVFRLVVILKPLKWLMQK